MDLMEIDCRSLTVSLFILHRALGILISICASFLTNFESTLHMLADQVDGVSDLLLAMDQRKRSMYCLHCIPFVIRLTCHVESNHYDAQANPVF